jgi:hypothetical protein
LLDLKVNRAFTVVSVRKGMNQFCMHACIMGDFKQQSGGEDFELPTNCWGIVPLYTLSNISYISIVVNY